MVTREILKNTGTENDPTEIRLLLQNEILANIAMRGALYYSKYL